MIGKILCKLGFHDWYYHEEYTKQELRYKVKGFDVPASFTDRPARPDFVKKVCLREGCKKVVDTITPAIEELKREIEAEEKRKEQVKAIVREVFKDVV